MGSDKPLHILLFPFMAQGHILPMLDMAKLFAVRGLKATILTTPANSPLFQPSIDRANGSGYSYPIQLHLIPFPSGSGLPEGCENMSFVPSHLKPNFFEATRMLREPFDQVLRGLLPDCVVTGAFFPWTTDVAAERGIPRLVFYGSNYFSRCASYTVKRHKILENSTEEMEPLLLPDLPHRIELLKSQIQDFKKAAPFLVDLLNQVYESESRSYGLLVNSFYELEPDYADYYRNVIGGRTWAIGPMSLCNEDAFEKSSRGNFAKEFDHDACLNWLDSKSAGSVIYVCFGSACEFTVAQLRELALGLEASNHPFIWVVRKGGEEAIPRGFEERVKGKGFIIQGWAPQVLILNHKAVGGFLTHCGWNSSLEGISAGLPFITWPLFAEQFYNERLITDVLRIGIAVGVKEYTWRPEERALVEAAIIEKEVNRLMGEGEEAEERRRKAKELGEKAKKAVDEEGSSYVGLSNLIEELKGNVKNQA
ncbi:scopoletin glucosyltransferase-like [Asparagus officinalis]|uniref:scopoletin glucosyltransferase-like n=1 Tax=Asparagus officinalis TaxID=4686 RepID=UPI00098E1990|nr:scopoletin glucosyltransferase-like [Asparagus officinalis]